MRERERERERDVRSPFGLQVACPQSFTIFAHRTPYVLGSPIVLRSPAHGLEHTGQHTGPPALASPCSAGASAAPAAGITAAFMGKLRVPATSPPGLGVISNRLQVRRDPNTASTQLPGATAATAPTSGPNSTSDSKKTIIVSSRRAPLRRRLNFHRMQSEYAPLRRRLNLLLQSEYVRLCRRI